MDSKMMIEVNDLHRSLPLKERELAVLRDISFEVAAGEWVALTGPSGSGKSTLLGLLAGIDRPTRGSVRVDGMEISSLPEARLARVRNEKIGIIFQAFYLIQSMNALENVAAPLYISPLRRRAHELAQEMLDRVGLSGRLDHLPNQLSGGEQQRVAIARALVAGPRVLLADEPTGNLDSATSAQVLGLIRDMRDALNLTIVMVTHDPQVAGYADRQLHLLDGRLVNDGLQPAFSATMAGTSVTVFPRDLR
jgi:putative ABC transport system ATP-binding protein